MEIDRGLLLILGQVPSEFEGRFNEWYDEDHAPARLAVPGILTARRYKEASVEVMSDSQVHSSQVPAYIHSAPSDTVTYLTFYGLANLEVLDSAEYGALSIGESSALESEVKQVAKFDRRVYDAIPSQDAAEADQVNICGRYLLCVWQSNEGNHREIPVPSQPSGLLRTRRYRLNSGRGAEQLTLFDIESRDAVVEIFEKGSFHAVRNSGDSKDSGREIRLFQLHRRFDHANPPTTAVDG